MVRVLALRVMVALAAAALLAGYCPSTYAAIVLGDWKTPGDNLLVTDTATGLQWLNLTQTANLSYNAVTGQLSSTFAGFSVASASDVATFFTDAGLVLNTASDDPTQFANATLLLTDWGTLYSVTNTDTSTFFVSNSVAPGMQAWGELTYWPPIPWQVAEGADSISILGSWQDPVSIPADCSSPYYGTALIRVASTQPVPEPTTLTLWSGLGAMGLLAGWRRRKQRGCVDGSALG
jgi:hypothetical protein